MEKQRVCPVCGDAEYNDVYVSSYGFGFFYSTTKGEAKIRVCTKCGCVYAGEKNEVKPDG